MARAPAGVRLGATNGQLRNLREATFGSRWHRGRFSVEIVLALAAGVAAFVLAAIVCAAGRNHVPAALLGALLLLVVSF